MKQIYAYIILAALLFSACAREDNVSIDPDALALELTTSVSFTDTLEELDEAAMRTTYQLDDSISGSAYAGTGATSEEVAVLKATDSKTASTLLSQMQQRLDDRAQSYASYLPDEVYKIEHALLVQKGQYVILCVTDDVQTAQTVLDTYLK